MKYIKAGVLLLAVLFCVGACENAASDLNASAGTQAGSGSTTQTITSVTVVKGSGIANTQLKIEPDNMLDKITSVESDGKTLKKGSYPSFLNNEEYFIPQKGDALYDYYLYFPRNYLKQDMTLTFKSGETVLGSFKYNGSSFESVKR